MMTDIEALDKLIKKMKKKPTHVFIESSLNMQWCFKLKEFKKLVKERKKYERAFR
jgi:hypothetical protein